MERATNDAIGVPKAREGEPSSWPASQADPAAAELDAVEPEREPDAVEAESGPEPPADVLTDRERDILDFEQQWWRHPGSKEQAIRDRFQLSSTRYYQLLNG